MKLRDKIAIEAMHAMIRKDPTCRVDKDSGHWEGVAAGAYHYADAMIRARKRRIVYVEYFDWIVGMISGR